GTSDPYVILQLHSQVAKSTIKWGAKDAIWNEEFALNIKQQTINSLQVAAWDANLITPHKRMGNALVDLENLCDGNSHELLLELEGMGGGGRLELEVKYKSFKQIDEEKLWWNIPIVTEFLQKHGFAPALKMIIGSETVQARDFVQFAFGQLKSLNDSSYLLKGRSSSEENTKEENSEKEAASSQMCETDVEEGDSSPHKQFWKTLADSVSNSVVQKLGLPPPEKIKWEGFELLKSIGLQSFEIAEKTYLEYGLVTPSDNQEAPDDDNPSTKQSPLANNIESLTKDILRQTDSILGGLMVVNAAISKVNPFGETRVSVDRENKKLVLDDKEAEEMRALFSTAESAMEAWAMLANALGHPTFIKSEFEKICFLENAETDTQAISFRMQVAIWRDTKRKRLVIAFRGTEQVHGGFLNAYDSVRTRLMTLIRQAIDQHREKWHVYVTGHSLGGALATLHAFELSSSQLAKQGAISVTMYNFGSPRVGNRIFAQAYNEKVKNSWRVVNHRDIIPTVPRLMGYCHVAQPVYLGGGAGRMVGSHHPFTSDDDGVEENGYEGDVIGEATADVLVTEFMRGEREMVENILNTEINIFRSIRDGTALMQHMEDFYYITLLESVRSNYPTVG
ncbi:hypothetical protein M569_11126, partial [Genlisea aurea]